MIRAVGSNQTVLTRKNGLQVLFSYETPVAALVPNIGYVKVDWKTLAPEHRSRTTRRHINNWLPEPEATETRPLKFFKSLEEAE